MSGLTDATRAVASLVDDAVRYGLPEPKTFMLSLHTPPTLIMSTFAEVESWAEYLHTTTEQYTAGETEHINAPADVSDVYGISVRVTTNRDAKTAVTP